MGKSRSNTGKVKKGKREEASHVEEMLFKIRRRKKFEGRVGSEEGEEDDNGIFERSKKTPQSPDSANEGEREKREKEVGGRERERKREDIGD